MGTVLGDKVIAYFKEMCPIYRESGHEEKISEYLVNFAMSHRLKCKRDRLWNVVMKKDATGKFVGKNSAPVILQAHMDMVCVPGMSEYDWKKGVNYVIAEGNRMRGQDPVTKKYTSLGADDGIGVASILAILDSKEAEHPPIVAIFTTQEETGMDGAKYLSKADIQEVAGDLKLETARFINIDEEQDGRFCAGCAGGVRTELSIPVELIRVPSGLIFYNLSVSGLNGGHSGICMGLGRANAHRLLGRLLNQLKISGIIFNVYNFWGSNKENAIPTDSNVGIAVSSRQKDIFEKAVKEMHDIFYKEYNHGREPGKGVENNLKVSFTEIASPSVNALFSDKTLERIITAVTVVPNDVINMDINVNGLVETSSNLGVLKYENNKVSLLCAVRSSVETRKRMVTNQMKLLIEGIGGTYNEESDYPGWTYKTGSKLQEIFLATYKELFKEPVPSAVSVHAGLECGFFAEKFGDIDMIACGPTINDVHSINETLHLDTVPKTVELLAAVLGKLS